MPQERYFIEQTLTPSTQVLLSPPESHHLTTVMRGYVGKSVTLVNGKNQCAQGRVLTIQKKGVSLQVEAVQNIPSPTMNVVICQAIPRLQRIPFILEKGCELGASAFWFFPAEFSEKKILTPSQQKRFKAITIAALKQCGRFDLPEILVKPPLKKWSLSEIPHPAYYGDLHPKTPLFIKSWDPHPLKNLSFFIGPESGFSDSEKNILKSLQIQAVRLHTHTLRTETVSLVVLSLMQYHPTFLQ